MSRTPAPWREALRSWFRPPRTLKTTKVGRTYIAVTLFLGLGALNTGNNMLYLVLGLMLSLIVVSGVLSERCLRDLRVRRLGASAAYARETFPFRWALSRSGGTAFALTVSEVSDELSGAATVAVLEAGAERVVRADLLARRRGPHRLRTIKVTTTFPLGFFAKSREFDLDDTLVVFPARRAVADPRAGDREGKIGEGADPRRAGGVGDVLGLAELKEGDEARHIHWKKSAAVGRLLKTEREREERQTFILRVDPASPPESLERECEQVAAEAKALLWKGHEVGLEAGLQRIRPASGEGQERRILRALAWVGHEQEVQP